VLGPARAFVIAATAVAAAQNVETANCQAQGEWASGLQILNLNKRELTNIDPLRHFGSLKELYLYDNRIQDMSPIVHLGNLETVSLATNQISSVPRLQSSAIKSLNLNENRIANVASLSDLQSLRSVSLRGNLVDDASPLRLLAQISSLDLRSNRIRFMRGLAHWSLPQTYISGNPICDFPHESNEVMQACRRRPLPIIDVVVRPTDDIVLSPHVIVDPGNRVILFPRNPGLLPDAIFRPNP
jgi:Leucine-rich repeat (LRR) protein